MNAVVADTIVAPATGVGVAAIAVVRMSGGNSLGIARALIEDSSLPETGRVSLRWLNDPNHSGRIDQVLVTVFEAPRSYTGEDVVEFSCHGGAGVSSRVVGACEQLGARLAEPGEFTKRAYLNGRMDLVQAEAVADLIEGNNEALQRAALHQLDGGLSLRLASLREAIVSLEALLVHHIDFPDEDEPPVSIERVVHQSKRLASDLAALAATAPEGELLREGVTTVLAGPANAGKSSLFNALIGHERAIVTEVPGTTRDALEAKVSLGGFPFLLVDTAGLRESEDQVERMGIEVAERYLAGADLVLFCREAGDTESDLSESRFKDLKARVVRIVTKADKDSTADRDSMDSGAESGARVGQSGDTDVRVSVHTGQGLGRLKELLPALAFAGLVRSGSDAPVVTRARQRRGIEVALEEVRAFGQALTDGVPAEVASTHLRPAATALEELLGVIPNDEVLDQVFRDFCIGK